MTSFLNFAQPIVSFYFQKIFWFADNQFSDNWRISQGSKNLGEYLKIIIQVVPKNKISIDCREAATARTSITLCGAERTLGTSLTQSSSSTRKNCLISKKLTGEKD